MAPEDATKDSSSEESAKLSKVAKQKVAAEIAEKAFLSKVRPKKRFVFFALFWAMCIGVVLLHDPCDVRKKRQDCGYSGISPLACRTTSCFTKGGGDMEVKKITLKRKKGTKLGLVSGSKKDAISVFVKSITEGAVTEHNAKVGAEDQIYARDTIVSIDGGSRASLKKSLAATDKESVVIELKRSKLPSYLMWIHRDTKPNIVEKILTAPGTIAWTNSFSKLGGLAFSLWFISGYPLASLPLYYWGVSGMIALHMSRCCHDEKVPGGVPHCYRGEAPKLDVAIKRLQTKVENTIAKIQKSPRSYLNWLFRMPTSLDKWL